MGFGKKLKKAFKKVTNVVSKVGGGALDPIGSIIGGKDKEPEKVVEAAPAVQAPPPTPQAIQTTTEVAKKETDGEDEGDTEAAKKAARRGGKKNLSVARSSGTGINI